MKHAPIGREESKTARGWDPRTHVEKSKANSRRTSTFNNWYRRVQEATHCDQAARRVGADVPGVVTTAQGPENDGAYLEPVTRLR